MQGTPAWSWVCGSPKNAERGKGEKRKEKEGTLDWRKSRKLETKAPDE